MRIDLGARSAELIDGIAEAARRYDAFLVDVWGVLHDSARAYPGVIDCLQRLQAAGKTVLLLSNAARRAQVLEQEFVAFGILPGMYNGIVSSGELTWQGFATGREELAGLGRHYYLLGSAKYRLTEGLPLVRVRDIAAARFILAIGVSDNPATVEKQEPVLREGARLRLPMVCANPDIQVIRDGVMGIAPGALAARYEELGGEVIYFGKPHRAVYERCFELLGEVPRERIAAVGDALKTDVAGGSARGLATIIVGTGLHAGEIGLLPGDSAPLAEACKQEGQYPTLIVRGFRWQESPGEN